MKYLSALFSVILLLAIGVQPICAQSGDDLFQQALQKEQAEGDLEGAISLYQKIVNNLTDARDALVARALLQMGKSYEKLGADLVDEARQAYERIVRDYADQPQVLSEAQLRLAGLAAAMAATTGPDEPKALTIQKVLNRDFYGSLSPDGRYFTQGYVRGGPDLGVFDMKTEKMHDITYEGTWDSGAFADHSIWSPDSKQVAYLWNMPPFDASSKELRIVGRDGGEPRVVTRSTEAGISKPRAWSSDGKYILAVRGEPASTPKTVLLVLVDVETGSTKTVTRLPEGTHTWEMSFSPDDKYIAYETYIGENETLRNIHIVSTDGRFDQPLIEFPGDDHNPFWTPDGSGVVFVSDRTGSPGLWYVAVSEGIKTREPQLVHTDGDIFGYGFSNDGRFFYSANRSSINIIVADVDLNQGSLQVRPELHAKRFEASNTRPVWSPDGSKLAYLSVRGPETSVLVIRDAESGEERDVHPEPLRIWDTSLLQWSPDGKSILVVSGRVVGLVDIETDRPKRLLVKNDFGSTTLFTPDGASVVFYRHPSGDSGSAAHVEIVVQNIDSGIERLIGETIRHPIHMSLSPDGSQLAYFEGDLIDEESREDLVIMSVKDGSTRVLIPVSLEHPFFHPAGLVWTKDGKSLLMAFQSKGHTEQQLFLVDSVSGERKPIGNPMNVGQTNNVGPNRVALHPNGKTIAYSAGTRGGGLYAIKNLVFDK